MKTISLAFLVGSLWVPGAFAQDVDASAEAHRAGMSAMQESRIRKQAMEQKRRMDALLMKQPVVYSGFLVDYTRAESKTKLLSLRQPAVPLKDAQNVFTDITNNRPKGFVLFALSF